MSVNLSKMLLLCNYQFQGKKTPNLEFGSFFSGLRDTCKEYFICSRAQI